MKNDDRRTTDSAELRRRAEERLTSQPPAPPDLAASKNVQWLTHELQVRQIELELQNEELRESQAEAEAGRARYTELYDFAPAGYITLSRDSTIAESNLAASRLLSRERAKLRGQRFALFVTESDRHAFHDFLQQVFANQTKSTCEVALSSSGQPSRIVLIDATLSPNEQECHAVLLDITERRHAETALRTKETHLRAIFDTEPECVKLLAADGTLLEMNPAGLRMLEADSFQQVKNQCIYPFIVEEHREAFRELNANAFRGESGTLEFQLIGLKGRRLWLETHASPLRDATGRITALVGVTRDVTEQKRAEAKLVASEAKFRAIIERGGDAFLLMDANGAVTFNSPANESNLGYSDGDNLGRSAFELVHPDDQPALRSLSARLLQEPDTEVRCELRGLHRNGSWRWLDAIGRNRLADPNLHGISSTTGTSPSRSWPKPE